VALKKLTWPQRRELAVAILAERFHLKIHEETKMLSVYDLFVSKTGPKFKESIPASLNGVPIANDSWREQMRGNMIITNKNLTGVEVPISTLAAGISGVVDRDVIDRTGLTGKYDFSLSWTPEQLATSPDGGSYVRPANDSPVIFTALQEQLGLKLVADKGPVKVVIVDHVEMPSEN
jgi:uncharacterized protein (TIGR03435 family)